MEQFLDAVRHRMTEEDLRQLRDIYEPTVVTQPDADVWQGLTIMRDGRIRFYGDYRRKSVFDDGGIRCYRESCDGGLSWKKHLVENSEILGTSVYVPFLDQYMTVCKQNNRGAYLRIGTSPDDPHPRTIQITDDEVYIDFMPLIPLRTRNRLLLLAHENRPERHPSCFYTVLWYSDDGGEHWVRNPLGECPYYETKWPDQGNRWQQNTRENTIAELTDGTLVMMSRTAMNVHYQAFSYDGGEHWTDFEPSCFHAAGTMPKFLRLHDGRLLFFWCNTKMMPEVKGAAGIWEDYFTNRDVNHCAVSEDEGKTWFGYRELFLNPIRANPDFRADGGPTQGDKSIHQFECLELPENKVLVAFGQNYSPRQIVIFDVNWLYEHSRTEDLLYGFRHLSTQNYLHSQAGGIRVTPEDPLANIGHCAYNRTSVTLLMPSPENPGKEALHITRSGDERLVSGIGGAVWNFPVHQRGRVTVRAYLPGKGLRVSLLDYWMNPSDDTAAYFADYSIVLRRDMQHEEMFTEFLFDFDCERGTVLLHAGDYLCLETKLNGDHPNGLCYLHLQSAATEPDAVGSYVTGMRFEAL